MHRIGIDEVGRGSLAGPVFVAAVALPKGKRLPKALGELRDSKKMTRIARECWEDWIRTNLAHALSWSSAASVDARNVSACANACALRCFTKLRAGLDECRDIHLDGGLFLGTKRQRILIADAVTCPKADEDFREVALASILAKVTRDRMMRRFHLKYPEYGFETHVGYGTRAHWAALEERGPSPIHRLTFLRSLGTMGPLTRT